MSAAMVGKPWAITRRRTRNGTSADDACLRLTGRHRPETVEKRPCVLKPRAFYFAAVLDAERNTVN